MSEATAMRVGGPLYAGLFVHDDARSYVVRHDERFDVIQASLVPAGPASTAAGEGCSPSPWPGERR